MERDIFGGRNKSKLDRMNDRLNSRTKYKEPSDIREPVTSIEGEAIPEKWESPDIDELIMGDRRGPEHNPIMKKIFFVALLFFLCAALAAALIYFKGDNFVSTKNLDISVQGPVSIGAGNLVELEVTITNKNNAALDRVNLNITYPSGARNPDDPTKELSNTKEVLEELAPGGKITQNERAVFLGSEGEVKEVRLSVDYRVKGSNATFTKEKVFELTIGSAPVTISVSRPEVVNSGEDFTATISIVANSEEILHNVILRTDYPYGWNLKSSTPQTFDKDKRVWLLGDLSPGDKKTVSLQGTLTGEDNEERTFRYFVGVGKAGESVFDTTLSSGVMSIAIKRPALDLGVRLNGDATLEYVAPAGKQIQGVVNFKNNLTENLTNSQIEVKLSGSALDRLKVSSQGGGFYNSSSDSIVWNGSNFNGLKILAPGDSGSVTFNFSSLENLPSGIANQKIDLTITLTGRPQNSSASLKVSQTRSVKIASEVSLTSVSLYSRGPFGNSGPIPPQAEKETSYAVTLGLVNTQNDVNNAKVTAILGPNVKWNQEVYPGDSGVTYDDKTRIVTWDVGVLPAGTGFASPVKEMSVRLLLTPSLGQVGGVPVLLGSITFSGVDAFTQVPIRLTNPAVTTRITSDPRYVQGDEVVVK